MTPTEIRDLINEIHKAYQQDVENGTEVRTVIAGGIKCLVQAQLETAAQLAEHNELTREMRDMAKASNDALLKQMKRRHSDEEEEDKNGPVQ